MCEQQRSHLLLVLPRKDVGELRNVCCLVQFARTSCQRVDNKSQFNTVVSFNLQGHCVNAGRPCTLQRFPRHVWQLQLIDRAWAFHHAICEASLESSIDLALAISTRQRSDIDQTLLISQKQSKRLLLARNKDKGGHMPRQKESSS